MMCPIAKRDMQVVATAIAKWNPTGGNAIHFLAEELADHFSETYRTDREAFIEDCRLHPVIEERATAERDAISRSKSPKPVHLGWRKIR